MSDWTDEVRDRLLTPGTVSGTWGVPEDGPWCVKREADIRAALGEIEHFHTVHKWCHRQPTHGKCCTCQACGLDYDSCRCSLDEQVERAEAAEQRVKELEVLLEKRDA